MVFLPRKDNIIFAMNSIEMKIQEIISILEQWAPAAYAEDFDNVGLLVGNKNTEVTSALITLDTTEDVVEEAPAKEEKGFVPVGEEQSDLPF